MAAPTAVTQRVQQMLTNGSTGMEPVLPNQNLGGGAPTPSPTFAPSAPTAPAPQTQAAVTPQPGATKTFTNGNVGRWDGQGWVHVNG